MLLDAVISVSLSVITIGVSNMTQNENFAQPNITINNLPSQPYASNTLRHVNKVLYILMAFFVGGLGVHRFLRGQVGLGILMILVGWMTLGIWWLIDFIISLTKLSSYPGDDYIFTPDGRWAIL